jgi:hypothetical protein
MQGWKGSVKARHFVLALNDYYTEKFSNDDIANATAESNVGSTAGSAPPSPIMSPTSPAFVNTDEQDPAAADDKHKDDRWALAYINVAHVQSILEAVDDDGTVSFSPRSPLTQLNSPPPGLREVGDFHQSSTNLTHPYSLPQHQRGQYFCPLAARGVEV